MIRNININVDIGYLLCRMYALCLSSMGDFLSVTLILLQSRKRKRQRNNNNIHIIYFWGRHDWFWILINDGTRWPLKMQLIPVILIGCLKYLGPTIYVLHSSVSLCIILHSVYCSQLPWFKSNQQAPTWIMDLTEQRPLVNELMVHTLNIVQHSLLSFIRMKYIISRLLVYN